MTDELGGICMTREITDFSKILSELREWGFNDYKMAELTGIERSKLSKFRTGDRKNPTYDDGCVIIAIYRKQARKRPCCLRPK